ncbi:hypothetical protein BKA70DRAFT_561057 [Coprinopsis sp. MPI-PUGE-AT-0042]|nr:hypothetical protein BKA70DRAFT_561057 [Coprinopsis sp. MPI-PUGE-AT-0042]
MPDNFRIETIQAQIITATTPRPFTDVVSRIEGILGAPRSGISGLLSGVKNAQDVVDRVKDIIRDNDFLIFEKLEHYKWMRLFDDSKETPTNTVYIIGNPLIARQIWAQDMRGALFLPFRLLLVDKGEKGTEITYHLPSSLLPSGGSRELRALLESLDKKVDSLVRKVAGDTSTHDGGCSKL